jgi:hypothetical protein
MLLVEGIGEKGNRTGMRWQKRETIRGDIEIG